MADKSLPAVAKQYNSILEMASDVKEEDVIYEARCKICNLEIRHEVEQYWEAKKRSHMPVVRLLEEKGIEIDDKSVARHMWKHYVTQQKKLSLKDYAVKLSVLEKVKSDRLSTISLCRAALINEFMDIGSRNETLDLFELRKNVELMIKLSAEIMAIEKSEKDFFDEWKPAKIVIEKLTQIIQLEGENAPVETRLMMAKVVDTLYSSCEGLAQK
jgi:hypothetical protein